MRMISATPSPGCYGNTERMAPPHERTVSRPNDIVPVNLSIETVVLGILRRDLEMGASVRRLWVR